MCSSISPDVGFDGLTRAVSSTLVASAEKFALHEREGTCMIDAVTSALFSVLLARAGPAPDVRGVLVAQTVTDGDAAVLKRAATLLAELQAGTIDRSELSTDLSAAYTKTVLSETQKTLPHGEPDAIVQIRKNHVAGDTTYVFRVKWAQGTLDYTFSFDDTTFEIVKLYFRTGPPN